MHEEVHLPYSLDGFNVCLELAPSARGRLKRLWTWCPKSMRCHEFLPTSITPVIQEKTVNCSPSHGACAERQWRSIWIRLNNQQEMVGGKKKCIV